MSSLARLTYIPLGPKFACVYISVSLSVCLYMCAGVFVFVSVSLSACVRVRVCVTERETERERERQRERQRESVSLFKFATGLTYIAHIGCLSRHTHSPSNLRHAQQFNNDARFREIQLSY